MTTALILAGMPDMWQRLLDEHVADGRGRCRSCRDASGVAEWPCLPYEIAQEAQYIYRGGLPVTAGRHRLRRVL